MPLIVKGAIYENIVANMLVKQYSLNVLIDDNNYKDIKYGIKLANKNIGFNGKFYTIPYFMTFLLKIYLMETKC